MGIQNERRDALVSSIDLAPTLLSFFNVIIPENMQGKSLNSVIKNNEPIHDGLLFGIHGGHVNCTDGRYVYMRAPLFNKNPEKFNQPLFEYTLMPTHMRCMFSVVELQDIQLAEPFSFTK